jgi:hypothetical protein
MEDGDDEDEEGEGDEVDEDDEDEEEGQKFFLRYPEFDLLITTILLVFLFQ